MHYLVIILIHKIIKEIKSKPNATDLKEQKKISAEIVADLKERGITFFTDKIGRKTPIEKYIKMKNGAL